MTWTMPSKPSYIGKGKGQFSSVVPLMPYKVGEWMVMEDLQYVSLSGKTYTVPKYFVTDLASIPWIAEPAFNGVDSRLPGVLHDFAYCLNQQERSVCDDLLSEALSVTGCDPTRRRLIHAGVRVGGWYRYNQCKGGPKREDFAWEYMSAYEVILYEHAYKISVSEAKEPARSTLQGLITDGMLDAVSSKGSQ